MKRYELLPGVWITEIPADKFKRCRMTVNFILPGRREDATALALLPLVMGRGFAACPDMTQLSLRLACLYGASLSCDSYTQGANRVVSFSVTGIRDAYAPGGEALTKEYLSLLREMIFRPDVADGAFRAQPVEVEKDKLRELCESEINEKRIYCMKQARRRFFGDDPAGLERYGYPEEIPALTGARLYEVWQQLLREAQLEVFVMGTSAGLTERALREELAPLKREPQPLCPMSAMPRRKAQRFTEEIDAVQGKVCMLFTAGAPVPAAELPAMRMAVALLGGVPTSRLFMNVREKQSLCYYCSAAYTQINGVLMINGGVEFEQAERLTQAALHEWECLRDECAGEKEIEDTRRQLQCALASVNDSMSSLENWYTGEVSRGTLYTPEEASAQLEAVTAEDVRRCMERFTLTVVYTLTDKKEEAAV